MNEIEIVSDKTNQHEQSYKELFKGKFYGVLRWHQLDSIWEYIKSNPETGWYVYEINKTIPDKKLIGAELISVINLLDSYIRESHDEEYCGIIYADNLDSPEFIKVFDPNNLGTSCSIAKTPPLPKWIVSLAKPDDLTVKDDPPNKPKRWLGNLFAK